MVEAFVVAVLLGLLVGSFLNVCIFRTPRDISVVRPRSFCPACEKTVVWHDNIPLLSYVLLGARCRNCRARIPWRYPFVELVTALLFAATVWKFGVTAVAAKWMVFECLAMVLFWTDVEERLLPDEFTLGGILLALGFGLIVPDKYGVIDLLGFGAHEPLRTLINIVLDALLLSMPFALVGYVYSRFRKIIGPGMGDVKLLAMLGAFLGLHLGLVAVMVGGVLGVVIGLPFILITKNDPRSYLLPLGSFVCAVAVALVFWPPV